MFFSASQHKLRCEEFTFVSFFLVLGMKNHLKWRWCRGDCECMKISIQMRSRKSLKHRKDEMSLVWCLSVCLCILSVNKMISAVEGKLSGRCEWQEQKASKTWNEIFSSVWKVKKSVLRIEKFFSNANTHLSPSFVFHVVCAKSCYVCDENSTQYNVHELTHIIYLFK